jgi:hypothetical protein
MTVSDQSKPASNKGNLPLSTADQSDQVLVVISANGRGLHNGKELID